MRTKAVVRRPRRPLAAARESKRNSQPSRRKVQKKQRKRPPYLSAGLVKQLRAVARTVTSLRDKAILLVLIDSGLQPIEIVGLSRGQIRVQILNRLDGSAKVQGNGRLTEPAAEMGRTFTIGQRAVDALREYLERDRVRGDHPALFLDNGRRMLVGTLMQMIDGWLHQTDAQSDRKSPEGTQSREP